MSVNPDAERLAAIDIGSNSIHMVVAEAAPNGGYRLLGREREMVRLGKTGLSDGALSEEAMQDGLDALAQMTTIARLRKVERGLAGATRRARAPAPQDRQAPGRRGAARPRGAAGRHLRHGGLLRRSDRPFRRPPVEGGLGRPRGAHPRSRRSRRAPAPAQAAADRRPPAG